MSAQAICANKPHIQNQYTKHIIITQHHPSVLANSHISISPVNGRVQVRVRKCTKADTSTKHEPKRSATALVHLPPYLSYLINSFLPSPPSLPLYTQIYTNTYAHWAYLPSLINDSVDETQARKHIRNLGASCNEICTLLFTFIVHVSMSTNNNNNNNDHKIKNTSRNNNMYNVYMRAEKQVCATVCFDCKGNQSFKGVYYAAEKNIATGLPHMCINLHYRGSGSVLTCVQIEIGNHNHKRRRKNERKWYKGEHSD